MITGMLRRDLPRADRMVPLPQAAGALLHPVTLLAIAALLLNDHIFKHTWPGTWWTGKLSDIAWMVFALPAFAFILALVATRTPRWSNRVFVIAYAGLSLLYLAYNLNEPLHDLIMAAFAALTKAEHTSPFDPTDALVIPPALALATWVWRSGRKPQLRRVPAVAVVAVAVLASVASSEDYDSYGVQEIGVENEELIASVCFGEPSGDGIYYFGKGVYTSRDGGLTWFFLEQRWNERCNQDGRVSSIETPRGVIELRQGEGVFLVKDGDATLEVDTSFMDDPVVKALTYEQVSDRDGSIEDLTLGLFDLEAAPSGGNVVVATGHNGVLVGKPDGSWEWANVGPYRATSQSPAARRVLISKFSSILVFAVAGFLGAAIPFLLKATFSPSAVRRPGSKAGLMLTALFLAALAAIWSSYLWRLGHWSSDYSSPPIGNIFIFGVFVIPVTVILLTMVRFDSYFVSVKIKAICVVSGAFSCVAVIVPLSLWAETTISSLILAKIVGWAAVVAISATAFFILRQIRLPDYVRTFENESENG
jgi:hypothetical protein